MSTKIASEDLKYLNKIHHLSKTENFKLIFVYSPFIMKQVDVNNNYAVKRFAKENDIPYIDGYESFDKIRLNPKTDFYDEGHLNTKGATKFSKYLIQILEEKETHINEMR